MTTKVIENLRRFNRKERYWLLREACNYPFTLSCEFREKLQSVLRVSIPDKDVFVAMDYHFDWITMAVFYAEKGEECIPIEEYPRLGKVNSNQEDVDLLVAFEGDDRKTHLIMIEAKVDTDWTPKQLKSKMKRLKMFNDDAFDDVKLRKYYEPHLVFVSPEHKKLPDPSKLREHLPNWLKERLEETGKMSDGINAYHVKMPRLKEAIKVTRKRKGERKGPYTHLAVSAI